MAGRDIKSILTGKAGKNIVMAAGVIMTLPLVIMVLLFQRRIVAGLAAGGLKQ